MVLRACALGQEGEDRHGSSFVLPVLEVQVLLLCLGMNGRLPPMTSWVKFVGCFIDGGPWVQVRYLPTFRQFLHPLFFLNFLLNPLLFCIFAVKKRPQLKSRYKARIQVTFEYSKTIDDFDNLVDPRTLPCHYLGPKPSSFVLHAIEIEEKIKFSF